MAADHKRPITISVPAEVLASFDHHLTGAESRSGVLTDLMRRETARRIGIAEKEASE